jgi:hypothetical protein
MACKPGPQKQLVRRQITRQRQYQRDRSLLSLCSIVCNPIIDGAVIGGYDGRQGNDQVRRAVM